ncbi:uncharacterized protein [Clytia hemisphaerica]|uniref:uncharacterized protein n=1 Tax=Clytia hemisphaerica TaxID=252671 RepID=UPI0034D74701
MTQLGEIQFRRAVIPEDAISTNIQTLDFGDASQSLVCVCIYARYTRRNGQFSSQLVFARSRTVPNGLSLPRAELMASLINTHTGEVVKRSFGQYHKSNIKFTDSQIALHWITNDEKPLKLWARNRVIDINRFSNRNQWFYINTADMMADIGTRRGATLEDVQPDSPWFNGHQWMHLPISDFPIKSAQDLRLSASDTNEVEKERMVPIKYVSTHHTMNLVQQRYKFSQYLVDPNRHRFSTVIRIFAYVRRYSKTLFNRSKDKSSSKSSNQQLQNIKVDVSLVPMLTNTEIEEAEQYFFKKSSSELLKFLPKSKYERITKDVQGILTYTGRILPDQEVLIVGRFTGVMKDLSSDTFCVPVMDRYSPVAYSIALETHWHHPTVQHSGIETTLRYTLKKCHIIEGRALMKQIKKACQRCRFLEKRTIEMSMGPISRCNMTIAPAFYHTRLDLSGPYQCYAPQHKRTTVKIWLIVFCCCSTTATKIYTMDDYTTTSFIQAITRFSANHGFPNQLLCDEGSQLVKGCKEMNINISDLQQRIQRNTKVNFNVCPVQGHNMHGKVERKIKEINSSISKSLNNQRLAILQWETLVASIANQINNLPLAIGDVIGDFEVLDLITPNRLLLGRNNDRSIDGLITCDSPTKIIKENEKCFNAWFETWLLVHVPKLMKQQKWFHDDSLSEGDIVIFTKVDSVIQNRYTYGIISALEYGNDSLPRRAKVQYRNANEAVCRETYRSVRGLVKICGIDENDLIAELGALAKDIDLKSNAK